MKRRSWLKAIACIAVAPYEAFIGDVSEADEPDEMRQVAQQVEELPPPKQRSGTGAADGHVAVEMDGMRYVGTLGMWNMTYYARGGKVRFELEINQPQAVRHG